jgi:hypothetical protein
MTNSKLMLTASAAVVMLGVTSYAAMAAERGVPAKGDVVIAADDSDNGSAKMGGGEGTQSGDEGVTPENDTQKVDQPDRRNPTTSNDPDEEDDVMPPPEDEEDSAPSDEGEPPE